MNSFELKALKIYNFLLSIGAILLAGFILIIPYKPEIEFQLKRNEIATSLTTGATSKSGIKDSSVNGITAAIPKENKLQIDSIFVNGIIHEGDKSAMDKGLWHRPGTSTPDKGGNTVIVAHRFLFRDGPNTFYNLDKVKIGEEFSIAWKSKMYNYKVFDIKEVFPTEVYIEDNTKDAIVTLYTCTPLFTAQKRLVVRGKLIKDEK